MASNEVQNRFTSTEDRSRAAFVRRVGVVDPMLGDQGMNVTAPPAAARTKTRIPAQACWRRIGCHKCVVLVLCEPGPCSWIKVAHSIMGTGFPEFIFLHRYVSVAVRKLYDSGCHLEGLRMIGGNRGDNGQSRFELTRHWRPVYRARPPHENASVWVSLTTHGCSRGSAPYGYDPLYMAGRCGMHVLA